MQIEDENLRRSKMQGLNAILFYLLRNLPPNPVRATPVNTCPSAAPPLERAANPVPPAPSPSGNSKATTLCTNSNFHLSSLFGLTSSKTQPVALSFRDPGTEPSYVFVMMT